MGTACTVQLYLVRHGITIWNQEKKYLGHRDQGVLQEQLVHYDPLKKFFKEHELTQIFCSDLTRCRQTAAYLFTDQTFVSRPIHFDSRLRELHFGEWEGKKYNCLKEDILYQQWLQEWQQEDSLLPRCSPPEGESGTEFAKRIDSFLGDWLQHVEEQATDQYVLMVTHGGVIRYILSQFVIDPTNTSNMFWRWRVEHGHAFQLSLRKEERGWQCVSWLEVPMQGKEV